VLEHLHEAIDTDPTTVVPHLLRTPIRLRQMTDGSRIDRSTPEGIWTMSSSRPSDAIAGVALQLPLDPPCETVVKNE